MAQTLTILFLSLHLMAVNVSSAAPLICIWLDRRGMRGDETARQAGRYLAFISLQMLLIGGLLGVAVGVAEWSDPLRDALMKRLPSKISFGVWEYLFSVVLLGVYAIWWRKAHGGPTAEDEPSATGGSSSSSTGAWLGRSFVALLATTNLLYHFPFLFAVLSEVAGGKDPDGGLIDAAAFRHWMADGAVLSRAVHFWLASVAMSGLMLMGFALRSLKRGLAEGEVRRVAIWGGRIALVPTVMQLIVGFWVLLQLSPESQHRLMGGDMIGSIIFAISILAALALMHRLAKAALGDASRKTLSGAMAMMTITVVLMTAAMVRSRPPRDSAEPPAEQGASQNADDEAAQ